MIPNVILHMGVSVDGRIDWGLGDPGPYYALTEKLGADLDLSGSSTVLKAAFPADPQAEMPDLYNTWIHKEDRPRLAIVDSQGQVKNWAQIRKQPFWRDWIALCSRATPQSHLDYLREEGVDMVIAGEEKVDLRRALEELNERCGVRVVRVDSGGILNGALLRAGLVSEVSVIVYPCLVGGTTPKTMFVAPDLTGPEGVIPLKLARVEEIDGKYVWMRYAVDGSPFSAYTSR